MNQQQWNQQYNQYPPQQHQGYPQQNFYNQQLFPKQQVQPIIRPMTPSMIITMIHAIAPTLPLLLQRITLIRKLLKKRHY